MAVEAAGERIHRVISERKLDSIVGSSCVGKSTLERAVRTAFLEDPLPEDRISVPSRVVTRPRRFDDGDDIFFCSSDELDRMVANNRLGLYGIKIMEGGRQEPYGYLQADKGTLPIFFANNQTLKNRESVRLQDVLEDALLVLVYAPDRIREERLRARSPQLFVENPDEVGFRLSSEEKASGLAPYVHLIVRNYERFESRSAADIVELIKGIVAE